MGNTWGSTRCMLAWLVVAVGACAHPTSGPGPDTATAAPDAPTAAPGPGTFTPPIDARFPLARMRAELQTEVFNDTSGEPPATPPPELFELVRYPAPLGANAAYVTPVRDGPRRPAIVWIAGGFTWGIGPGAWTPAPRDNDQSAATFRRAGIVLMRPSLRGTHDNPGRNECFLGEVDDVLAAVHYLRGRKDVDPERIYVGGHSTGGTMALLVAASSAEPRAVFAFGAAPDARLYAPDGCIDEEVDEMEGLSRSSIAFLKDIRAPTFVIEGAQRGWADVYPEMAKLSGSAPIHYLAIPGADHFNVLAPGSEVVAEAILADRGAEASLTVTPDAVVARMKTAGDGLH